MRRALLTCLLALPGLAAAAGNGFDVQRLADGVYAAVRTDPVGLMVDANCTFIVNATDVVVVDAPEASRELIAALKKLTSKPVSYVINTHWHDDHVIGNAAWRAAYPDVKFIGHPLLHEYLPTTGLKNREGMISGAPQFAGQMRTQMEHGKNLRDEPISAEERTSYTSDIALVDHYLQVVPGTPVLLPDVAVADHLSIVRGTRRIEVQHLGRAHTSADLVVWLPAERIAITGDMVIAPVPLVGNDQSHVGDWGKSLRRLVALHPALYVPGHGPVLRDDTYPLQMAALFDRINAQVQPAVARGEALDAARKSVDLAAERKQFAGDSKVRHFSFGMYVIGPAVESAWRDATAAKAAGGAGAERPRSAPGGRNALYP